MADITCNECEKSIVGPVFHRGNKRRCTSCHTGIKPGQFKVQSLEIQELISDAAEAEETCTVEELEVASAVVESAQERLLREMNKKIAERNAKRMSN